MAKLHHATLKAAVSKYGDLHFAAGKTEEEIKAAIATDEKKFDADAINEIYAAIISPDGSANKSDDESSDDDQDKDKPAEPAKKVKSKGTYVVTSAFRDKDNWEVLHHVGKDVSGFDDARIQDLLKKKLVEKQ